MILGAFLYRQRHYIVENYALRPTTLLAISALVVAALVLRALANQILFGRLGLKAPFRDWFGLTTVTAFANYLPLSAGLVAKAMFLRRLHGAPYRLFAVGQIAMMVIFLAASGAVGFVALLFERPSGVFGAVGAGFAAMAATVLGLFLPRGAMRRLLGRWFPGDLGSTGSVRRAVPAVALAQAAILMATAMALAMSFDLGSAQVGFAACLIFSAGSVLTRLVSLTPGGLGIRELVIGGLAYLIGFEVREAVIASTVLRGIEIVVIFVLGGAFTYRLSSQVVSTFGGSSPERQANPTATRLPNHPERLHTQTEEST